MGIGRDMAGDANREKEDFDAGWARRWFGRNNATSDGAERSVEMKSLRGAGRRTEDSIDQWRRDTPLYGSGMVSESVSTDATTAVVGSPVERACERVRESQRQDREAGEAPAGWV